MVRSLLLAVVSALMLWAAFPPVGWEALVLAAPAGLIYAVIAAPSRGVAALSGGVFGAVFIGTLMAWISNLGEEAIAGLLVAQAPFYAAYAALLWGFRHKPQWELVSVAAGGWVALDLLREWVPFGGLNWGALGYPLGSWTWPRAAAQWIGTSGLGVVVAFVAAAVLVGVVRKNLRWLAVTAGVGSAVVLLGALTHPQYEATPVRVAIVQGNTPCPLEHCENERALIFDNHLRLTRLLAPGSVDLVVWPESATFFSVNSPAPSEGQELVSAEAVRLGATILVGGDRSGTATTFVNSNVVFGPDGRFLGEYRKNHPVPFGEYVPLRSLFGLIPETARVPRDMERGPGPVNFDAPFGSFGSVISFEGAFSRYSRAAVANGARMLVVASNEASYGLSPASEQFVAMTRMRAAENGVDLVHAAVTGSSVFITQGGRVGPVTDLFVEAMVMGEVRLRVGGPTLYNRWGDWMVVFALTILSVSLMWRWMQVSADQAAS